MSNICKDPCSNKEEIVARIKAMPERTNDISQYSLILLEFRANQSIIDVIPQPFLRPNVPIINNHLARGPKLHKQRFCSNTLLPSGDKDLRVGW